MKKGMRLFNFSRGELVDEKVLQNALEEEVIAHYVTDFPNENVIKMKNVTATPHLGASTSESEENCAVMAARQLREYLETGNIRNSVNYQMLSCRISEKTYYNHASKRSEHGRTNYRVFSRASY